MIQNCVDVLVRFTIIDAKAEVIMSVSIVLLFVNVSEVCIRFRPIMGNESILRI